MLPFSADSTPTLATKGPHARRADPRGRPRQASGDGDRGDLGGGRESAGDGAAHLACRRPCLETLRRRKVTHVLNVADDVPNYHEGEFTYLQLGVADFGADAGIARVFPAAGRFVETALQTAGGRVLIHCANGSNRSVTVAIAVLMQNFSLSLAEAWALV